MSEVIHISNTCPACGGAFEGACRFCGLAPPMRQRPLKRVRINLSGAPLEPGSTVLIRAAAPLGVDAAGHDIAAYGPADAVLTAGALEAAPDPLKLMNEWRTLLKQNGVLFIALAQPETAARWRIPRRSLMLMAERAGFRMIRHRPFTQEWWFRRY